ncbi:MAG: DUF2079 domain-containing protein [Myxococcales bacterium]|nr:DUF2079 domain-containing protein [Myxococcales bacterium]
MMPATPAPGSTTWRGTGAMVATALVTGLWVALLVWLQWARYDAGFHYEWEDDALSHQLLWNVGRGDFFENSIHPLHRPSHVEAALLWIWPIWSTLASFLGPWPALWLVKAALVASGALATVLLVRHEGRGQPRVERLAMVWAAVYLALPGTIALAVSTFRPVALAVGPLLFLLWACRAERWRLALVLAALVLSFREDLALAVVPLGAVAWWRGAPRWAGLGLIGLAATWFVVATQVVMPLIIEQDYTQTVVVKNLGFHAGALLGRLVEPTHLLGALAILGPVLFLPLTRLESIMGGASLAAVMLFDGGFAGNLLHFIAPAVAAAVGGAVIASCGRPWAMRAALGCLAATLLVHVTPTGLALVATDCVHNGPPKDPWMCDVWSPFDPAFRARGVEDADRDALGALIPPEASVTATGNLLPVLTPRATLWEYGHDDVPFATADYVALDGVDRYAGAGRYLGTGDLAPHQRALTDGGYALVKRFDSGLLLMKRHGAPSPTLSATLRALMPRRPDGGKRGTRSPGSDVRDHERGPAPQ